MATNPTSGNSGIGGATNSAPQPTYKCPYCGSTKTEFWMKVYNDPIYRPYWWLNPEHERKVAATYYKCEDCGCLFEAEVKRLG